MLSLFPQVLFLAPFSALVIRIALALVFAYAAWRHVAQGDTISRVLSFLKILVAAALLVGAWTQAVALVGALFALVGLLSPRTRIFPKSTVALVLVMCLSLVVTGAGALAFDLPL